MDALGFGRASRPVASAAVAGVLLFPAVSPALGGTPQCGGKNATMVGTNEDEILVGTSGDDVLVGRGGDDLLDGAGGDDVMCGGKGDDRVFAGRGRDELRGGRGRDLLQIVDARGGAVVRLPRQGRAGLVRARGIGRDRLFDLEHAWGTSYGDVLVGAGGRNRLLGLDGSDDLSGRAGDDVLRGGDGPDAAAGGPGRDVCVSVRSRRGCERRAR